MEESIKQQLLEKFLSIKETDHERYTELLGQLSSYYHAQCTFWITLMLLMLVSAVVFSIVSCRQLEKMTTLDDSKDPSAVLSFILAFLCTMLMIVFSVLADKYHEKSSVPEAAFLIEYKK